MNNKKIAASCAGVAAALATMLAPTAAQSAISEKSNSSCAALWARLKNLDTVQPLGQTQKNSPGWAPIVAQTKVSDPDCHGLVSPG